LDGPGMTHVVFVVWPPCLTATFVCRAVLCSPPLEFDELEWWHLTHAIDNCALVPSSPKLLDGMVLAKVTWPPAFPEQAWLLHHLKDRTPAAAMGREVWEVRH